MSNELVNYHNTQEAALREKHDVTSKWARPQSRNLLLEDVRIRFRNFSGAEGQYNKEGDRNFAMLLEEVDADLLASQGWNVKYLKAREPDEEPTPYIKVKVSFPRAGSKGRPPAVFLVSSKGKTAIGEDEMVILDWVDIARADVSIRPYDWEVNGKKGRSAYLVGIYVHIVEDELDLKYADVPLVSGQSAVLTVVDGEPDDGDIIVGELVED